MVALHAGQDPVRARLHWQVQVFHQLWHFGMGLDQAVGEFQWVRGGVANAINAINRGNNANQIGEVGHAAVMGHAAKAVHVLAQQGDFTHAIFGQVDYLSQYIIKGPTDFFTTGVGHHAEAAVLAATFHDGNKGGGAINARFWQASELFDLGEADIHLRLVRGARGVNHFWQAVQRLRAKDHVNVGGTAADRIAFLTGHATTDADNQIGVLFFQWAPTTELGKHLFLCLLADRTGVEQNDICVFCAVGQLHCLVLTEQVYHTRTVVLVHLATVGLDKEFLGHGICAEHRLRKGAIIHTSEGLCYAPRCAMMRAR